MKKIFNRIKKYVGTDLFWIILAMVVAIPAFWRLLQPGFFYMQDDLQAFRVYEMDKCLTDLQIPCRWVPDAGYKYGYPQFNYYPPLPYYIGALMHRAGIQYIDTIKILFVLGYLASCITLYVLIKDVFKSRWAGFVSAVVYTYIPYKAVEVYVRGALSEFWAQIFFPLIFWAIYKLIKSGKQKYLIWMALSIFFLLTTHVLMSVIFVPVALIWAIFWLIESKWKNLKKILLGGLLGFGLSAFFILPVLLERKFIHSEGILSGYFDYRQHFVSLYKLFISREWGYGSSGFPNEKLNLSLGFVQWILGLIVAPAVAISAWKKDKKLSILAIMLSILALGSIFMIHMKSSFIWSLFPFLWYLQFPWRFLAVSIFLLSVLVGLVSSRILKFKYILGTIIISVSILTTIGFFIPKKWLNITDIEKFSGVSWQKQLTISIFDYLPIYAKLPPIMEAPELPEVLSGSATFSEYNKGSNFQEGLINVTKDARIRLPLFDFPGMQVKVNGEVTKHINNDCTGEEFCLGLITFDLPIGNYDFEVKLTDTPVRKFGNYLTVISGLVTMYLIFRKNEKDN